MNWEKDIVRRTMEGAGHYPGVQLQFLLTRLEAHPGAVPAIAEAIRDMGHWYNEQADALANVSAARDAKEQLLRITNGE